MPRKPTTTLLFTTLCLILILCSCSAPTLSATPTSAPAPTATLAVTATNTRPPSFTPLPTRTPYLTGTAQAIIAKTEAQIDFEKRIEETERYYDLGYLNTTSGTYRKYTDFNEEWAQLGWYYWWPRNDIATNFYMSAHFKWSSAYRSADVSGCGFIFGLQENSDHYAVFLDRSVIEFLSAGADVYASRLGTTRGTGRVDFNNPADEPVEADFTLIVKDAYAYVLVNGDVVGEYTLAQSRPYKGWLGLTLLSGTNRDFGTRCEMTNIYAWIQD
jgi:hypothetical protein